MTVFTVKTVFREYFVNLYEALGAFTYQNEALADAHLQVIISFNNS